MNVFSFIIAFVFFIAGLVLFAFAFNFPSFEALMFCGGIAAISIALVIPFHILGHGEQR
jgi:cytochrome c oxidase assembly factor CtaG